jgi:hypothetical protein
LTASTLLATAAATIGIGLATATPASADQGNILPTKPPSISQLHPKATPSIKIDPVKVAKVRAFVDRVLKLAPKRCPEPSEPTEAS